MPKHRSAPKPQSEPTATVENPNWSRAHHGEKANPRFVTVRINPRESAITELAARKAISASQVAAADKFRALFEAMGGSGARGNDTTKEFVDGGRFPELIGESAIFAGKLLAKAHQELTSQYGREGWRIVGLVCGEGHSIHELTGSRRQRDTMADNLRAYLDCLAKHWGFSA